jgi:fused signal recognition particle receptor
MIKWFKRKKRKSKVDLDQEIEQLNSQEVETESFGDRDLAEIAVSVTQEPAHTPEPESPPPAPGTQIEEGWQENLILAETGDQAGSPEPEAELEALPESETEKSLPPQKRHLFGRLRARLTRTREALSSKLDKLFLGKRIIDLDLIDELEELLISADMGVETSLELIEKTRDKVRRKELTDPARLKAHLKDEMLGLLTQVAEPKAPNLTKPQVVMVIGVNGVGKTTTIAKLAHYDRQQGINVLLVAADTFRAAAVEQLEIWGQRVGVPVIKQKTGSDPAAVVFDGLSAALSRGIDKVYIDTAGRLHTKVNLMEELKKVRRTADKQIPGAPHEVFLVLDATTGQNAISQSRLFHEAIGITGIIMTKLDGTAKGGVAVGIVKETGLPLKFIGVGEQMDDLRPFDPEAYLEAILG